MNVRNHEKNNSTLRFPIAAEGNREGRPAQEE